MSRIYYASAQLKTIRRNGIGIVARLGCLLAYLALRQCLFRVQSLPPDRRTKKHGDSSEVMKKTILLQGYPGVGKTTAIKKIIAGIKLAGGFCTEETREGSTRKGFAITTLEGKQRILAYEGNACAYRVGKYGVDIEVLESAVVESIRDSLENMSKRLIVIDAIGKMELLSSRIMKD